MTTAMDKEIMEDAKEDLRRLFSDYSIDITFTDFPSCWGDEGTACLVKFQAKFSPQTFEMRLEIIEQVPSGRAAHIEFGEDNWEELDDEQIWRWLFFEAITQGRRRA